MAIYSARTFVPALTAAAVAAVLGLAPAHASIADAADESVVGHVYESTYSSDGNAIQVFDRLRDGRLRVAGRVATGGRGLGASLASQIAVSPVTAICSSS